MGHGSRAHGCWAGVLALCYLCACGRTEGEFSPAECTDGLNNDGDAFIDCDDPDCRGLQVCAPKFVHEADQSPLAPLRGTDADVSSLFGDAAFLGPEGDASVPDGDEDGGTEPSSPCDPDPCDPGESCRAGVCFAQVDAGPLAFRRVSVFVASADLRTLGDVNRDCLDPDCGAFDCYCRRLPDPYAEVRLNGAAVGRTSYRTDELEPTWDEAPIEVRYEPGDRLEVLLIDHDDAAEMQGDRVIDDAEDDTIFQCTLMPPSEGTLVFSCAGPTGSFGTSTMSVLLTAL